MAKKLQLLNDSSTFYLCDTFQGVVNATDVDTFYSGGEHADTDIAIVEHLAGMMKLENIEILQGIFPKDTATEVTDERFRFCHIDVDVYQSGKDVLEWIWDRLVPGGIIVFDDYGFNTCPGITKLVEEISKDKDKLFIWNSNGQGYIIKNY
jgi:O-methyltransferase